MCLKQPMSFKYFAWMQKKKKTMCQYMWYIHSLMTVTDNNDFHIYHGLYNLEETLKQLQNGSTEPQCPAMPFEISDLSWNFTLIDSKKGIIQVLPTSQGRG